MMDPSKLTVLVIDDNPNDAKLLYRHLEGIRKWEIDFLAFTTSVAARERLRSGVIDVIFIDYLLGNESGMDILKSIRDSEDDRPVIMLTGFGDEHVAVEAMKAGADDYLSKREINSEVLQRSIRHSFQRYEMKLQIKQRRLIDHHFAYHDDLTKMPNRRMFFERLGHSLTEANRNDNIVGAMILGLDRFDLINDTYGYAMGDNLLKSVAKWLTGHIREGDFAAHLSAAEFGLIINNIPDRDEIVKIAQNVLRLLSKSYIIQGHDLFITASVGISLFPVDGNDAESLVKNAGMAMRKCKASGGNSYEFFDLSQNEKVREQIKMEKNLRQGLKRKEFQVYYQPQVDINSGLIIGMEALLRWRHRKLGMIPPKDFIPLAEDTGLIVEIGEWALYEACLQARAWETANYPRLRVAINLSARQFRQEKLLDRLNAIIRETMVNPERLVFEITESNAMQNTEFTIGIMREMKEMGVHLHIDDFGTGYSSLSTLKRFPLDALKIDMSFVQNITRNQDDAAITKAIIAMAHSLQLETIAEGIETTEQKEFLLLNGCNQGQGYLYSQPLPAEEATALLAKGMNFNDKRRDNSSERVDITIS